MSKPAPPDETAAPKPTIIQIVGYYPPHLGGMEVVAQEISSALAEAGWPVEVITSSIDAANPFAEDHKIPYKLSRLRTFEFAHTPFMPALLWCLLRVKKPAIFHLHLSQAYLPEMVWLSAKLRRIPYVVHFHLDAEPSGRLGFLFVLYKRFVQPVIMRGADQVIALSPEQAAMIQHRYHISAAKVSFLPNGVAQKFLDIGAKDREAHTPLRLLYVGRLSIQKRVDRLIEALTKTAADVQLAIIGDGEDRAKLQALAEEHGLQNITFHGTLAGDELLRAYEQADVFVLPSDKEGMPLVLLEAMAAGLPVIGSDVQGIREHLAGGNGILVKKPSPSSFATAIDDFYEQRKTQLPLLSQAGRDMAAGHSWRQLAEQLTALYESPVLQKPARAITRFGLATGVIGWWLLFLGLRAAHGLPAVLTDTVGFSFLTLVPGMLTVISLRLNQLAAWGKLVLAIGFSLLELLLIGLLGNTLLQLAGTSRPLDASYLVWEISASLAVLLIVAWWRAKGWRLNPRAKLRELLPTRLERQVAVAPLGLVVLSILGATSLNNGGANAWTMVMLIGMAGFSWLLLAKSRRLGDTSVAAAITLMSLALLLMTSLRSWYTSGSDIQLEYHVFQLAKTSGVWRIQDFRDPYNACLSLTILPTMFANLLKVLDPYVYKVLFQVIFAFCPAIIYLLVRKWLSVAIAFLATLYFMAFPTFFTDLPFLNRQEIAFIFAALMFYVLFQDQLVLKLRRGLFMAFGLGLVLSHYSTTYSIIAILFMAAVAWPVLLKTSDWLGRRRLLANRPLATLRVRASHLKRISLLMVVSLAFASFWWTTVLTHTGSNTSLVIKQTFSAIGSSFRQEEPKSNDTSYNLFSSKSASPAEELNSYVKSVADITRAKDPGAYYPAADYKHYPVKLVPVKTQPLTRLGRSLESRGLDVAAFNQAMRQGSAKLLQILVISGFIYVLARPSYGRLLDNDFISLSIGSMVFVALQVVLPVLSVQYGLLRAFQQSLMLLGVFTVLGSLALFAWLPTRLLKLGLPVLLAILFFLSSTGVITQALGGYSAQLNLNNSGTYYDIYYTHAQEIAGVDWLDRTAHASHTKPAPEVQADQYMFNKLMNYSDIDATNNIFPSLIRQGTYVILGYSNVTKRQSTVAYNGDLITYSYPTALLDQQKNLLYSNGATEIYR